MVNIFYEIRGAGVPLLPQGVWEELNKGSVTKSSMSSVDHNDSEQFVSVEDEIINDFSDGNKRKAGEIMTSQVDKHEHKDDDFMQAFSSFDGKKVQGNFGQQRRNIGKGMAGGRGMKRGKCSL